MVNWLSAITTSNMPTSMLLGWFAQRHAFGGGEGETAALELHVMAGQGERRASWIAHQIGVAAHRQQHMRRSLPVALRAGAPKTA